MPCNDGGFPRYDDGYKDGKNDAHHNSPLAEMVCDLCRSLEALGTVSLVGPNLLRWWKEHKVRDERRRNEEDIKRRAADARRNAISKLTPYERELLGIKE